MSFAPDFVQPFFHQTQFQNELLALSAADIILAQSSCITLKYVVPLEFKNVRLRYRILFRILPIHILERLTNCVNLISAIYIFIEFKTQRVLHICILHIAWGPGPALYLSPADWSFMFIHGVHLGFGWLKFLKYINICHSFLI